MPEQRETKHTPPVFEIGLPYTSNDLPCTSYSTWVSSSSDEEVFQAAKVFGSTPDDSQSFAHLIAAAPELLAALKRIHKEHGWCWLAPIIAKAEGRDA